MKNRINRNVKSIFTQLSMRLDLFGLAVVLASVGGFLLKNFYASKAGYDIYIVSDNRIDIITKVLYRFFHTWSSFVGAGLMVAAIMMMITVFRKNKQ